MHNCPEWKKLNDLLDRSILSLVVLYWAIKVDRFRFHIGFVLNNLISTRKGIKTRGFQLNPRQFLLCKTTNTMAPLTYKFGHFGVLKKLT